MRALRAAHAVFVCVGLSVAGCRPLLPSVNVEESREGFAKRLEETRLTLAGGDAKLTPDRAAMLDAVASYMNEPRLAQHADVVSTHGHKPPQLFPRLVTPAVVPFRKDPGDWNVPLLLDRSLESDWIDVPIAADDRAYDVDRLDRNRKTILEQLAVWIDRPTRLQLTWKDGDSAVELPRDLRQAPISPLFSNRPFFGASSEPEIPPRSDAHAVVVPVFVAIPVGKELPRDKGSFVRLKIVPRLKRGDDGSAALPELRDALEQGDWCSAGSFVHELRSKPPEAKTADAVRELGARLRKTYALRHLYEEVDEVGRQFARLGASLERDANLRATVPSPKSVEAADLAAAAARLIWEADYAPCPALLEPEGAESKPFSFVVAGDFQQHGDILTVERFLTAVSPKSTPLRAHDGGDVDPIDWSGYDAETRDKTRTWIEEASFVVVAGDLADAAAGNSLLEFAGNAAGILPSISPYTRGGREDDPQGEFIQLKALLGAFDRPVFGVPGNHDGYTGLPGLLEVPDLHLGLKSFIPAPVKTRFSIVQSLEMFIEFGWYHAENTVGRILGEVRNERRVRRQELGERYLALFSPQYDGLAEWQAHMGLLNFGFRFRGCGFVGLNSYHLDPFERAGAGAVVFFAGGGVKAHDVAWFDGVLGMQQKTGVGRQFVFMHHDPRGAIPGRATEMEENFGRFDAIEGWPVQTWTLGFAGVGYNTEWPIFLPLVTPAMHGLTRSLGAPGKFQMEWMRKDWLDDDCYHARSLVESIGRNLSGDGARNAGIVHAFFAHDDLPVASTWSDDCGNVFHHRALLAKSSAPLADFLFQPVFRLPTNGAPDWAQAAVSEKGKSTEVTRLDSINQYDDPHHGFHVVRVETNGKVIVRYVPLKPIEKY
jgi:hypothetical protein